MHYIKLITNDDNKKTLPCIVPKADLKKLKSIQYLGGFLRFHIDIYDDKIKPLPKGKNTFKATLNRWLSENIFLTKVQII